MFLLLSFLFSSPASPLDQRSSTDAEKLFEKKIVCPIEKKNPLLVRKISGFFTRSTASISCISSRGRAPGKNILYSPLAEEGAFSISSNLTKVT
jgi:hypothetical protein